MACGYVSSWHQSEWFIWDPPPLPSGGHTSAGTVSGYSTGIPRVL